MFTFQKIISILQSYWHTQGCAILIPYDMEVGAATSHTATFLRAIGPEPWRVAYVQPTRRPKDGRYGSNPNRLQQYHQYQVIFKPLTENILDLYIGSLTSFGLNIRDNDIRLVEDNWENPTLGAWGLGWEIWLNGMEISQFTYFQQVGGIDCKPVLGEITYGLERLAMYLQEVESVYDLVWTECNENSKTHRVMYKDIYLQNEVEQSIYNFEESRIDALFNFFSHYISESERLTKIELIFPAYEMLLRAIHTFNLLDARNAISVTERITYISNLRALSRGVAQKYYKFREKLGFPLL